MWNLKPENTDELLYETAIDPQTQKTNLRLPRGRGGEGRDKFEGRTDIVTLLYIKQITSKDLLSTQGTRAKNLKRIHIYVHTPHTHTHAHTHTKLNQCDERLKLTYTVNRLYFNCFLKSHV